MNRIASVIHSAAWLSHASQRPSRTRLRANWVIPRMRAPVGALKGTLSE